MIQEEDDESSMKFPNQTPIRENDFSVHYNPKPADDTKKELKL